MEKLLLLFIVSLSFSANCQTNYTITANFNSWSSNLLRIEIGDSVTFVNSNHGIHNINGTTESFPYNPESFGMLEASENWVYGYRFQQTGTYSFRCDYYPSMMGGVIVVQDVAGTTDQNLNDEIYPNPTEGVIHLTLPSSVYQIKAFDMLGNLVLLKSNSTDNEVDLSQLNPGVYLLEINGNGTTKTQRIVKK